MISVIIPTFNEKDNISTLVSYLKQYGRDCLKEIIVSDGGSQDETLTIAEKMGAHAILSPQKGRAAQMNHGALHATGDILYFVHADTLPPFSFCNDIEKAVLNNYFIGRYQTRFESKKFMLKLNAFFTRFDLFMCYGGDQSLYVEKKIFEMLGGYNSEMKIMEDYEIIERAKRITRYKILSGKTTISARKYETNSWLKVQKANYTIVQLYKNRASQETMVNKYKEMLHYR